MTTIALILKGHQFTSIKETGCFEHKTCPLTCRITARHTVSERRLALGSQLYVMIVLLAWLPPIMAHPVQQNQKSGKHPPGLKPELRLPPVLAEWAALMPLTIYLESSFRHDYQCAGESALTCKLSIGIFPKLWAIGSVTKLLRDRENFLDMAITTGPPMVCLDVQWGNNFPCANSAATAAVAEYVLSTNKGKHISIDDLSAWIRSDRQLTRRLSIKDSDFDSKTVPELLRRRLGRQRKQTLHVLRFSKKEDGEQPRRRRRRQSERSIGCAEIFVAAGLTVVLAITGNYGSGALVFLAGITRSLSRSVVLERPESYLHCGDDQRQRCILTGPHENASTWHLFLGDVSVIDTLLIKPMVIVPPNQNRYLIHGFSAIQVLQLLLMTYVASQKQWDGVCLLLLVLVAIVIEKLMGPNRHAREWLEDSGYTCDTVVCEFAGRHDLMGAVQCISGGKETAWMDKVLQIAKRRTVWLGKIGTRGMSREKLAKEYQALSAFDIKWVDSTAMMSFAGEALIRKALGMDIDVSS
jgi:hypothetical protein